MSNVETRDVSAREFKAHHKDNGTSPTVKVTYTCGTDKINDWLCPEHAGFAKHRADKYWKSHGGNDPVPNTVLWWLARQRELGQTRRIAMRLMGKFHTVVSYLA